LQGPGGFGGLRVSLLELIEIGLVPIIILEEIGSEEVVVLEDDLVDLAVHGVHRPPEVLLVFEHLVELQQRQHLGLLLH